jgi:hypothetical protein
MEVIMFSSDEMEQIGRGCVTVIVIFAVAIAAMFFGVGWLTSRAINKPEVVVVTEEPAFKYGDFVVVTSGFFEGAKGYVSAYGMKLGAFGEKTAMKYEVEFHRLPEGAPDLTQPPEVEHFSKDELRLVPVYGPLKPLGVQE